MPDAGPVYLLTRSTAIPPEREAPFRGWCPGGPRGWNTFLDRKLQAQNAGWLRGLFKNRGLQGVGLEPTGSDD